MSAVIVTLIVKSLFVSFHYQNDDRLVDSHCTWL